MKIVVHPRAEKFFKKLQVKELKRIVQKVKLLKKDPFDNTLNIAKMSGLQSTYRLRIGKVRIVYEVDLDNNIIYIVTAEFRGAVYS